MSINRFLGVAGIAVPNHARRRQLSNFVGDAGESIPMGVSVVDYAEVGICLFAGCGERINLAARLVARDFHVVATAVADAVGADAIVIACGRLQTGEPDSNYLIVHVGYSIAATFHALGIREVGL